MSEKSRGPRRHGAAWELPDGRLVGHGADGATDDEVFDEETPGDTRTE